jgi:hypothetical protein
VPYPLDYPSAAHRSQRSVRVNARADRGTLILATSGIQLANGFFNTLISLRVVIEDFAPTSAGLVLSSYFSPDSRLARSLPSRWGSS